MRHDFVSPGATPVPMKVFSLTTVVPGYLGKSEGRQVRPPCWNELTRDTMPTATPTTASTSSSAHPPATHQIQTRDRLATGELAAPAVVATHCVPSQRHMPSGVSCPG